MALGNKLILYLNRLVYREIWLNKFRGERCIGVSCFIIYLMIYCGEMHNGGLEKNSAYKFKLRFFFF